MEPAPLHQVIRGHTVRQMSTIGQSIGLGGATHGGIKAGLMMRSSPPRHPLSPSATSAERHPARLPALSRSRTAPGMESCAAHSPTGAAASPTRGALAKRGAGEKPPLA